MITLLCLASDTFQHVHRAPDPTAPAPAAQAASEGEGGPSAHPQPRASAWTRLRPSRLTCRAVHSVPLTRATAEAPGLTHASCMLQPTGASARGSG